VGAGDHELRVGQHARAFACGHRADREFLDLIGRAISRLPIGSWERRRDPAIRPRADRRPVA